MTFQDLRHRGHVSIRRVASYFRSRTHIRFRYHILNMLSPAALAR